MASSPRDVTSALTAGVSHRTGAFAYDVQADRWWWSDEVYRMHGFEPGEVVPTTAMILAHKHPEDRDRYAGALTATSVLGGSFASVHRIIDAQGQERVLATIGIAQPTGDMPATRITGQFVDVTGSVRALAATEANRQIKAAESHRAVIDQAMGIAAARTGLSVAKAFDLLRLASMRSNIKIHTLAERVVGNVGRSAPRGNGAATTIDAAEWLTALTRPASIPHQHGPDGTDPRD